MKFAYFAYFYRVKYFKNIMNQRGNCSIQNGERGVDIEWNHFLPPPYMYFLFDRINL